MCASAIEPYCTPQITRNPQKQESGIFLWVAKSAGSENSWTAILPDPGNSRVGSRKCSWLRPFQPRMPVMSFIFHRFNMV